MSRHGYSSDIRLGWDRLRLDLGERRAQQLHNLADTTAISTEAVWCVPVCCVQRLVCCYHRSMDSRSPLLGLIIILGVVTPTLPGCSSSGPSKAPPAESAGPEKEAPLEKLAPPAPPTGDLVSSIGLAPMMLRRICAGRDTPCQWVELLDAGKNAAGQILKVGVIDTDEPWPEQSKEDIEAGEQPDLDPDGDNNLGRKQEYWLATLKQHDGRQYLQSLIGLYAGAVIDNEEIELGLWDKATYIEIEDNAMIVTRYENGRPDDEQRSKKRYGLSPYRLLEDASWHSLEPRGGTTESRFDWVTLAGWRRSDIEYCSEDEDEDEDDGMNWPSFHAAAAQVVPRLQLPAEFKRAGWKRVQFQCGARLLSDTDGEMSQGIDASDSSTGYIIHGKSGGEGDSRLTVVMDLSGRLYIELYDDTWVTENASGKSSSGKWYHADHLEIWLSSDSANEACLEDGKRSEHLWQWGVMVGSGRVVPAYGKPDDTLQIEHMPPTGKQPARFAITLPKDLTEAPFLVVYSDSDNGARQEYLLATGQFKYGQAQFLSRATTFDEANDTEGISCVVKDGKLVVHDQRPTLEFDEL